MPYQHAGWSVPPILWVMLLAESGHRKTALLINAFSALRRIHGELWSAYMVEMERWRALPDDEKRAAGRPQEPHSFITNDATLEKLQLILVPEFFKTRGKAVSV